MTAVEVVLQHLEAYLAAAQAGHAAEQSAAAEELARAFESHVAARAAAHLAAELPDAPARLARLEHELAQIGPVLGALTATLRELEASLAGQRDTTTTVVRAATENAVALERLRGDHAALAALVAHLQQHHLGPLEQRLADLPAQVVRAIRDQDAGP